VVPCPCPQICYMGASVMQAWMQDSWGAWRYRHHSRPERRRHGGTATAAGGIGSGIGGGLHRRRRRRRRRHRQRRAAGGGRRAAGGVGDCLRLAAEHTTEEGDGGDGPDGAHARGRVSGIPCPCPALERDRARTPSSGRHTRRGRPRAACCACVWAARRGSARILRTETEALDAFLQALRQATTSDRSKSSREQHADSRVRKAGVGHPHRTRSGFGAVKSVTRTSMTPITPTAHLDRVR
jgi:hypothetical protein